MKPEEKARELVFKYEQYKWINHDLAKQCALIAVYEILSTYDMRLSANNIKYVYWHNVKQEIEKL
jgi:hypothetical protein